MPVKFSDYGGHEYAGSPTYSGNATSRKAIRRGYISWGQIDNFFNALFPAPVTGVPQLPDTCPGSSILFVESADFEPRLGDEDVPTVAGPPVQYAYADVVIQYATCAYEAAGDHLITRRTMAGGQMMSLPGFSMRWQDTGDLITSPEVTAAKFVGSMTHQITLHRCPSVPWSVIRSLVGTVNAATFEGVAAECLLFDSFEEEVVVTQNGTNASEVTLNFIERNVDGDTSITWNHLWDPATSQFRRVERAGYAAEEEPGASSSSGDAGGGLYEIGDYSQLY